ncbi:ROK family transcriptional regulator [Pelagibacterium sp.]|uniref:ROK family transcriptional regulator n=1 Tax=Pelagibacterium sp. TaxID=1967288 RepID=UPI003A95C223
MIRRQNRLLVLDTLRRHGPVSRSQVAVLTGLSNATLTAIAADLVGDGIVTELAEPQTGTKARGRPAVQLVHNRCAGFVLLIELDVNRCRTSLLDYGGVLIDRVETRVGPALFSETAPATWFIERIGQMIERNPDIASALHGVSISVQGILDNAGNGLTWSPISHLGGHDIVSAVHDRLGLTARLFKRGRLMADGMQWLDPALSQSSIATIYLGSTIGMGLTMPTASSPNAGLATEFGHMIHMPGGALCRCGARGCVEAYAADYAILRAAYSVPEHAAPANAVPPSDFQRIISRARQGDRGAQRAFAAAGNAIGHGISGLISIVDIDKVILLGPGTAAYDLMAPAIADGAAASLMGRMRGIPPIERIADAGEPIYRGLMMKTLTEIDRTFANRASLPLARRSSG